MRLCVVVQSHHGNNYIESIPHNQFIAIKKAVAIASCEQPLKTAFRASGAALIDIDSETKRILLRSRQATQRPSPEPSPTSSRRTSFADDLEEVT